MWKPLSGEQSGVSQAGSASGRRGRRGRRTRRAQRIPRVRPRRPLPALGAPLCLHPGGVLGAGGRSSEAAAPCPPPRPGRHCAEGAGSSEPRPSPARLHRGARTLLRHRDQTWSVVRSFRKLPILGQAVCLRAKEQCVNRSRPFKNKNKIEGSDGAPRRSWDAPGSRAGL